MQAMAERADKLNSGPACSRAPHTEELDIRASFAFAIPVFDQLTILAPGLLGGSVAKAAHARGPEKGSVQDASNSSIIGG